MLSSLKKVAEETAEWQKVAALTKTDFGKAMAHIRILSLGHRVVIAVDDAIEISGDVIGDIE